MEENLKERIEVQIESEKEEYTIDLSEKRVIIFSGDTYKLANMIPQFIMDCRGGVCSDSEEIPPFSLKYFLPGKDIKELIAMRKQARHELFELRMKNSVRALKETHKIGDLRVKIARINTVLHSKVNA